MSHLALKGTEITRQDLKGTTAQIHVKHTGEQGYLEIAVENKNIKVTYTIDRERKRVRHDKTKNNCISEYGGKGARSALRIPEPMIIITFKLSFIAL
jgi:hypothetical protein